MAMLLGAFGIVWLETGRPLPLREHLVRIDGTVEKMHIYRGESCTTLTVHIGTGRHRVRASNWELCRFGRLKPLPPGAPVSVLVEPIPSRGNLIWELRSGSRQLVAYEAMRAALESQRRRMKWVGYLLAAICLPLVGVITVWLWKELSRLARPTRSPGTFAGRD
jgi:hypothetical protein